MSTFVATPVEPVRTRRRRALQVTAFYLLLTVLFSWPLPTQLGTHQLGIGEDPDLFLWTLGWDAHAFLHQPFSIFDANIFYPAKYSLAYSENLIGSALLVAPWIWLTGDLMTAMNIVSLSSVLLSALGAYVLGRRLGLGVAGALIAGIVFGFTPARLLRMPQLHLTTIQWIPFCLAFLHTYFSPRGTPRDLRWAAAFYSLQALTSGHGVVFLTVGCVGLVVYRLALGEPVAPLRRVRDLGAIGMLALLPSILLLLPYRGARHEVASLDRRLDYGISTSSYLAMPSHVGNWLWSRLPDWLTSTPPDAYLFPGTLPIALALISLLMWRPPVRIDTPASSGLARWREHAIPFYVGLTLVSAWFTLGPPWGLWRWTYRLPIFSFLRVPSRFVLLEVLALAVLSGFGFERMTRTWRPRQYAAGAVIVCLALGAEFATFPLETFPNTVEPTVADRWLTSRAKPFTIAEVPVPEQPGNGTDPTRDALYMLHSTAHWQKTVHGYSGVEPESYRQIYRKLITFPDEESLEALADLGVDYVVLHPPLYTPDELIDVDARIQRYGDWLQLEHGGRAGRVYSLRRPPLHSARSERSADAEPRSSSAPSGPR